MISASDLFNLNIPPSTSYWGDLFPTNSRLAIIGKPKTAKSFFAIELAFHLATGTPFLGMDTSRAKVLYLNFEISQAKLQERIRDVCGTLGLTPPDNCFFETAPSMALETVEGLNDLRQKIEEARLTLGGLDVLIIDPRRQAMGGDENQSEIMTAWCSNVDLIRSKYNLAVMIVHHQGKSTTGAGRGSSVFDEWLDTILWLEPSNRPDFPAPSAAIPQPNLKLTKLSIQARDSDQSEMSICFNYPIWEVTSLQATQNNSKVDQARLFILDTLKAATRNQIGRDELRVEAMRSSHTNYAFNRALKQLEQNGDISIQPDKSKQWNRKIVYLLSAHSVP